MNEIRHSIVDELRRIAEFLQSDYEIAKERQAGSSKSWHAPSLDLNRLTALKFN